MTIAEAGITPFDPKAQCAAVREKAPLAIECVALEKWSGMTSVLGPMTGRAANGQVERPEMAGHGGMPRSASWAGFQLGRRSSAVTRRS